MGQLTSVENKKIIEITNFSKLEIPQTHTLLKIVSLNVNIAEKITMEKDIDTIIKLFYENYQEKDIDILCLQGIYSNNAAIQIVNKFKEKEKEKSDKQLYFSPAFPNSEIANISKEKRSSSTYIEVLKEIEELNKKKLSKPSTKAEHNNRMKALTQNIIISRYPIVDWGFYDLDDNHDADDVFGIKSMICANIAVKQKIISIYNTELSINHPIAGVNNELPRDLEIESLKYEIERNKNELKKKYPNFKKSGIHILAGCINVNEIEKKAVNPEYIRFIEKLNAFDIYRFIGKKNYCYTVVNKKERNNYIFQLLDEKFLKDEKLGISNIVEKISDSYGINFLNIESRKINLINKPVEFVFLMRN